MFFFFKRETAYEMRISDWVQTCALPILLCSAGFTFALFLAAPAFAQDSVAASSDDDVHSGGPIVVTAPYVRSLDILGNVSVLEGDELARDIRGQRSEEHTSELQSLMRISYAVFCLKQKKNSGVISNSVNN